MRDFGEGLDLGVWWGVSFGTLRPQPRMSRKHRACLFAQILALLACSGIAIPETGLLKTTPSLAAGVAGAAGKRCSFPAIMTLDRPYPALTARRPYAFARTRFGGFARHDRLQGTKRNIP